MGLGLLGRGLGDAIFLAEHGAELIVTDLRDEKTLAPSLAKLKKCKNVRYTLGEHKFEDFRNRNFIVKAAGVALDSPYIAEARKNKIPIEMDASLFAKLMPRGVTLVGVTGTRGKSTTTALIFDILNSSFIKGGGESASRRIFKGGNLVPEATLPLLEKVKAGDIVVLELDSWQLQGFHDAKISPQVAVFTTFLDDHLIYYKGDHARYFEDKVAIFKYQKAGDTLIAGEKVAENIGKSNVPVNGDFIIAKKEDVPAPPVGGWNIPIPGEHNLENIACAIAAAKVVLSTPDVGGRELSGVEDAIRKAVEDFKPIAGRLELIRTVKDVKIYNDNNATTPDATLAGLRALGDLGFKNNDLGKEDSTHKSKIIHHKSIILIMGGTDKGLDMTKLVEEIPKYCKGLVLLKESGTEKLLFEFPVLNSSFPKGGARRVEDFVVFQKDTLKECVEEAMAMAQNGDVVLFSPAFASFGKWFKNEYDRGEQFVKIVEGL